MMSARSGTCRPWDWCANAPAVAMKLQWLPSSVLCVALAAGCAKAPSDAPTVSYYKAHAEERNVQLAKCTDDPGSLGRTPACVNAEAAAESADVGSFRNIPPMGLPSRPSGAPGKH